MSWQGLAALLLVLAALGVAALAAGALVYSSLLPQGQGLPDGGTPFLVTTGGLIGVLVVAAVWLLRSRRATKPQGLDRSLVEAMMNDDARGDEDG